MIALILIIEHLTSLRSLITTAIATSGVGAALSAAAYHFAPRRRKHCYMYVASILQGAFYGWGAGFLLFFGVAGLYFPVHVLRNSAMTLN
eukprot:1312499-Amorphochlora_amoeboformis.AAC.1